jgi:hypothetical protein
VCIAAWKATTYAYELRRLGEDGAIDLLCFGSLRVVSGLALDTTTFAALPTGSLNPSVASVIFTDAGANVVFPPSGPAGNQGWSPVVQYQSSGDNGPGLYVADWVGGFGTKPSIGGYAGSISAADIPYDDSVTNLGAATVQEAIAALYVLIIAAVSLDFSQSANFALGIVSGAI